MTDGDTERPQSWERVSPETEPPPLSLMTLCTLVANPRYRPLVLPETAWTVYHLTQQDDPRLDEIKACLARDPMLAAQVLRRAQSPFYATATSCHTLEAAILRLGIVHVRDVVWECALRSAFATRAKALRWSESVSRHSTETAYLARTIAELSGAAGPDAFLAGLLHDLGTLALLSAMPNDEGFMQYLIRIGSREFESVHQQAGQALAELWQLPRSIREVIGAHHLMPAADEPALVTVVRIADYFARDLGVDCELDDPPYATSGELPLETCCALLSIDPALIPVIRERGNRVLSQLS